MPRVPSLDTFQTSLAAGPGGRFNAPQGPTADGIAARQGAQMGQALSEAGQAASRIALDMQQRVNETRVAEASNTMVRARADLLTGALQLRGKNALERPDGKSLQQETGEQFDELKRQLAGKLSNEAQREAFEAQAESLRNQMHERLTSHVAEEFKTYRLDQQNAAIETAVQQGSLLWGDSKMLEQSAGAIRAAVAQRAADQGWDSETQQNAVIGAMTPLHVGVMRGMIQAGRSSDARGYFEANSAGMTLQARAQMQDVVKRASDAQTAEAIADQVWAAVGPQRDNDAVRIFDMEKALRENLKDNPDAMALGLSALRQRAQAFNAQQAEINAQGVNSIYAQLDQGAPMSRVMRSDAWLAMPDKTRHEIVKSLEAEAAVREQRAAVAESRAFTRSQREQQMSLLRNADTYLEHTDPQKLAGMSREQVAALRPKFGMEATQHLLNRWDSLGKTGGKLEASIDTDTFNQVADELGLEPFKAQKTESERAQLGTLKYRIERLIDTAQQAKQGPLTAAEKETLVRGEMARQVTVNPGLLSRNLQVPVIALSGEQVADVVIPPTDRKLIVDALRQMYAKEPDNPAYAPTEQNVRRTYLRSQSKAGDLIRDQ